MLFGHGDNAYQFQQKIVADFSTNVFYKGPSEGLLAHLSDQTKYIGRYPEVNAESLTLKIAESLGLSSRNILVVNGATEAFYLIALVFQQQYSEIFAPSFAEYEDACRLYGHSITFTNYDSLTTDYRCQASTVWLCNPNNPNGQLMPESQLRRLIANNPQTTFIIDEAYKDFSMGYHGIIEQVKAFDNLIVVRSMTKKNAIPGLRLGYIVANEDLIQSLLKLKQPWTVNTLAIAAGKYICDNPDVRFDLKALLKDSQVLQQALSAIQGIEVLPSSTPFFLIRLQKPADKTLNYLVENHGILVRNASNFRYLDNHYLRISSRNHQDNMLLVNALTEWMQIP
ncbi:MAG: aminotransferase class I/II [Flavobacteriia bacterium]|nr:MAG: aminotransferase class I/II [Flavobacteriia bacterium]